ncbi:MAG: CopG family transcriptional regulator [bacterium]|nr:CopG family transcriptional regulator [bacterium]
MEKESRSRKKPTGIYLKQELGDAVKMLATTRNTSSTHIIDDALREYFQNHAPEIEAEVQSYVDNIRSVCAKRVGIGEQEPRNEHP